MRRTDWLFIVLGIAWLGLFAALVAGGGSLPFISSKPSTVEAVSAPSPSPAPIRRAEGVEVAARPASAPRAAPAPSSRGFEYVRYDIDVSGAAPRACLTFSAPLDPSVDYAPYVALEPATPAAVSASGQTLCVGGLQFGVDQELVLRAGLPALDGRTLARDERTPVELGDRPSVVSFSGSGVILPRRDADGLAIETVNVDAVTIKVSRVNDRALVFKRIGEGNAVVEGQWGYLDYDQDPWNVGEPVWEGEMAIDAARNEPATTVFPLASALGRLEPGAYFVEVTQKREGEGYAGEPASARRWILFTDLALTTYRGGTGLDVVLRSLQTAKPVAGAELTLLAANNEILTASETDRDGRVHIDAALLAGEGALAPRLVLAYGPEGDFAALDLQSAPVDLSGEDVAGRWPGRPEADVLVYLDRGIYRPGETVRASALMRDAQARALRRAGAFVVYRPNGLEAERVRFEPGSGPDGAAFHDYAVPRSAARGLWRIALELDGLGEVGSESFSVEDFVPQRVALELRADVETPIAAREVRAVEAEARFLYGAPGAGLAIEGEARIEADPSPFEAYPDYSFGRHDELVVEGRVDLPPTTADGAGKALVALDLMDEGLQWNTPLRVRAVIGVEEPGGRAVRDSVSIPYRPRDLYLGLDPSFDYAPDQGAASSFGVVAVGPDGRSRDAEVDWTLLRIDWDYDWWRDEYGEWRWRQSREVTEIEKGRTPISAGEPATIALAPLEWGDYELVVTDPVTGASASRGFWAGYGGSAEEGVQAPDRVRLTKPEGPLAVGSTAEIAILPPYAGEAEVVVATDHLIETRSLSVPEGGTSISFDVTEEWAAGAYVMVSVFTPRDPVLMPRPRRAVGVAHLPVDVSARTFEVALDAPDVVRPRQTVDVQVKTSGAVPGEGAWVTLAAVDEGILQLTKFQSPDPEAWYFGKKALGLELRDDYGRLLDPNQGAAAPVRAGGDALGGEGLTVVPTKTVALFSGPVKLSREGTATVSLELPDFNGELRLMAVAWSPDAVGGSDRPLTVRDPVPAELVLPRFLAPGDEAVATISVNNVEGAPGAYEARVSADELAVSDLPIPLQLASSQRVDGPVPIGAVDTGVDAIDLVVTGPGGFAVSHSYDIETRSPYLPARTVDRSVMEPGQSYSPGSDLLAGFAAGTGEVSVSFSPIPLDPAALYASLDEYPYGCTEQLVSRAMPLLYGEEIASLADERVSGRAAFVLQDAVSTLLNRQSTDGSIGLWRIGDGEASPWLGAFAVDFLARAKRAGYAVPDAALDRALDSLVSVAEGNMYGAGYSYYVPEYRGQTDSFEALRDRSRAYALYVLAREGRADVSRLRYVHDQELYTIKSPLARAHIAAALAFVDDRARSTHALDAAVEALGYRNEGDYYQTPRRDLAGVLALASEAQATGVVTSLAERVGEQLPDPDQLSTQEKAFLLMAAHALLQGRTGAEVTATGASSTDAAGSRYALTLAELQSGVRFENRGSAPVWRTTVARGAPTSAPPEAAEGLVASKRVSRLDGSPADLAALAQGDRLVVSIELSPRERRLQPLIVADLLPAGFEIETVLRPEDGAEYGGAYSWIGNISGAKITEARDDRFLAAVDLLGETRKLAYVVRAVTPGRFAAPGVVAEDMYRADVFARSQSQEVRIAGRS